jgi:hypothetical protein
MKSKIRRNIFDELLAGVERQPKGWSLFAAAYPNGFDAEPEFLEVQKRKIIAQSDGALILLK